MVEQADPAVAAVLRGEAVRQAGTPAPTSSQKPVHPPRLHPLGTGMSNQDAAELESAS